MSKKREFDRRSATGRSRNEPPNKDGHGIGNWGTKQDLIEEAVNRFQIESQNPQQSSQPLNIIQKSKKNRIDPLTDLQNKEEVEKPKLSFNEYVKENQGQIHVKVYNNPTVKSSFKKRIKRTPQQKQLDAILFGGTNKNKNKNITTNANNNADQTAKNKKRRQNKKKNVKLDFNFNQFDEQQKQREYQERNRTRGGGSNRGRGRSQPIENRNETSGRGTYTPFFGRGRGQFQSHETQEQNYPQPMDTANINSGNANNQRFDSDQQYIMQPQLNQTQQNINNDKQTDQNLGNENNLQ